jgi:hypothetical protein
MKFTIQTTRQKNDILNLWIHVYSMGRLADMLTSTKGVSCGSNRDSPGNGFTEARALREGHAASMEESQQRATWRKILASLHLVDVYVGP